MLTIKTYPCIVHTYPQRRAIMKSSESTIHDVIVELKEIRESIEQKKREGKKKPNKSKLNYLFSKKTSSDIKDLAFNIGFDGVHSESDIARAAMRLGIKALQEALEDDAKRASGIIHIQKLRAMFE